MCWYFYVLSIFTDLISFITFGSDLSHGRGFEDKSTQKFVLVMAIFVFIPKPFYAFFMYRFMKDEGVDFRQGFQRKQALATQSYETVNPQERVFVDTDTAGPDQPLYSNGVDSGTAGHQQPHDAMDQD